MKNYAENIEETYWNEFEKQWRQSACLEGFPNTLKGRRLRKLKKYLERVIK